MPHRHPIDVTGLDLAPVIRTARQHTEAVASRLVDAAKDATYITIGLGLLAVNRAQVQRRAFERSLRS